MDTTEWTNFVQNAQNEYKPPRKHQAPYKWRGKALDELYSNMFGEDSSNQELRDKLKEAEIFFPTNQHYYNKSFAPYGSKWEKNAKRIYDDWKKNGKKLDYNIEANPVENKETIEDEPMDIYPKIDYTIEPNQLDNTESVDNALSLDPQASVFENAEQAEAWTDKAINIPSAVKEELEEDGEISADGDKDTVYDNADATTQAAIDDYATSDSVYLAEDTVDPEEQVVEESSVSDEEVNAPDEGDEAFELTPKGKDALKTFKPTEHEHKVYVPGKGEVIVPKGTLISPDGTKAFNEETGETYDISSGESSGGGTLGDSLKNAAEEKVGYNLWDSIIKGV